MESIFSSPWRRRVAAVVGAGALALVAGAAFAAPAHADTTGGNVPAGPYNLTITKLQNPAAGDTSTTGLQNTSLPAGATPIAGVDYSIAPVEGLDLTTAAGWTTASGLTINSSGQIVDTSNNTYTTGTATALPATDGTGVTTYSTTTPDVYEVTETSAPTGTEIGEPFLVTLPLPQGSTSNDWLTNVYVYPKNTVQGAPVKTIDDSGAHGVGDTVNWTITSTVPNQSASNPFTQYTLSDSLDSRLTPPAAADVAVSLADSTGAAITLPAADYTVTITGQDVSVDFTAAGLALLTANPSAVITVGIPTVVNAVGSGTIQNTANQTIQTQNGASDGTPPNSTPSTPVDTTWGDVTLLKQDPNGNPLQGAQFEVFTSQADAESLTDPVAVNGATTFTSAADGTVAIDGLKAQDDGTGADLSYYLVETQAPAGYLVAPGFAQSSGGHEITVAPGGTTANPVLDVTDPQDSPIALPLTGSTGTAIFIGGGLGLAALAAAAAVFLVRRRREAGAVVIHDDAAPQH